MAEARNPRFLRLIHPHTLQNGTIEFPQGFLKKHGEFLPTYACLEAPTGAMWKVELKRHQGRVWLRQGLQDFVEHCSIKTGYSIVFRFDGGSFFHVHVFDTSAMEIEYPACSARTVIEVEDGEVEEDEEDDDRISDDDDDDGCYETSGGSAGMANGEDGKSPLQRAREFESENPYFFVTIKRSYTCSGCYMYVPTSHARSYFLGKENTGVRLVGADGRAWRVNYSARTQVRLNGGWGKFMEGYRLRAGDVCVFELVESAPIAYKVTTFRGTFSDGIERDRAAEKEDNPERRVMQRAKGFKSKRPHFMIRISQTYASSGFANIPTDHTRKFFKDTKKVIVFHGSRGRTRAKLRSGWANFVSDNELEAGDVCVFEMIGGDAKDYKVTVLRVADYA